MSKQDQWKQAKQERALTKLIGQKVNERIRAAIILNDPELHRCPFCSRVTGWKKHHFSHGCTQQGDAFGWTDVRVEDEIIISMYEVPGTLWYEVS